MKKKKLYTTPECDVINVKMEGNLLQETKYNVGTSDESDDISIVIDGDGDGDDDYDILAKPHLYDDFKYDYFVGWDK